ncbi:MAG: hypothetical protein ACYCSI_16625 [Solirubrobacteraceae bacterium]
MLAQIDARLAELDVELERANELVAERRRLVAARAAVTGEPQPAQQGPLVRRLSQDQIAGFLAEHPGARASQIAREFGVPLTNVSQHLHRARETRFERRQDGWHLREAPETDKESK